MSSTPFWRTDEERTADRAYKLRLVRIVFGLEVLGFVLIWLLT